MLKNKCFLYLLQYAGRILNEATAENCENRTDSLKEIQANLEKIINSFRRNSNQLDTRSLPISAIDRRKNQAFPDVMILAREFGSRTYDLIKDIRSKEKIPLEILNPLREIQSRHITVMTEICRATATLGAGNNANEPPETIAKSVLENLSRCVSGLTLIARIMHEKRDEIIEILETSSRLENEIQMLFL